MHREVQHFIKRIVASLVTKSNKHYFETIGFVRTRLAFAIVPVSSSKVKSKMTKWPIGFDNGAALPAHYSRTPSTHATSLFPCQSFFVCLTKSSVIK